jgi:hypothetical protein
MYFAMLWKIMVNMKEMYENKTRMYEPKEEEN